MGGEDEGVLEDLVTEVRRDNRENMFDKGWCDDQGVGLGEGLVKDFTEGGKGERPPKPYVD